MYIVGLVNVVVCIVELSKVLMIAGVVDFVVVVIAAFGVVVVEVVLASKVDWIRAVVVPFVVTMIRFVVGTVGVLVVTTGAGGIVAIITKQQNMKFLLSDLRKQRLSRNILFGLFQCMCRPMWTCV